MNLIGNKEEMFRKVLEQSKKLSAYTVIVSSFLLELKKLDDERINSLLEEYEITIEEPKDMEAFKEQYEWAKEILKEE